MLLSYGHDSNDIKNCWIMTYLGFMHVEFYLGWDENMPACATFEGCETITYYTISEPSLCKNDIFHHAIFTTDFWNSRQLGKFCRALHFIWALILLICHQTKTAKILTI